MQNNNLDNLYKSGSILMIVLTLVGILYAFNLFKESKLIGISAQNVISVSGTGKVSVKPDLASITFTIRETGKDAKEAQDKASVKSEKVLKELKAVVEEKDIRTDNYNSQPNYVYNNNSSPRIEGYTVMQSVTVKVRDTNNVSKVLDMVSTSGINEVNGPNYTVDTDDDKYKDQARELAIAEAKVKAAKLADQLGVTLGRVVTFSESSDNGYPMPVAYMAKDMMRAESSSAPSLPAGENDITSNVTITFELK